MTGYEVYPVLKVFTTLARAFFDLCLLKSRPQDLPHSHELLALCLFFYTLINLLLLSISASLEKAITSALLETLLVVLITLAILRLNGHTGRLVKVLIALAGTGCIISVLAIPLFLIATVENVPALLQSVMVFLNLILLIWNIVIMGHILRHAMDTSLGAGIVFAIIYILLTSMLISVVLPGMEGV